MSLPIIRAKVRTLPNTKCRVQVWILIAEYRVMTLRSEALSSRNNRCTTSPGSGGQRPSFCGSKHVWCATATAGSSSGTRSSTPGGFWLSFNRASRTPCRLRHSKHTIPSDWTLYPGSHCCTTGPLGNTPDFQWSSKKGMKRSIGSRLFRGGCDPSVAWMNAAWASAVILFPGKQCQVGINRRHRRGRDRILRLGHPRSVHASPLLQPLHLGVYGWKCFGDEKRLAINVLVSVKHLFSRAPFHVPDQFLFPAPLVLFPRSGCLDGPWSVGDKPVAC